MIYKVDATLWGVTYRFKVSAKNLYKAHELAFDEAHREFLVDWAGNPHKDEVNGLNLVIEKVG